MKLAGVISPMGGLLTGELHHLPCSQTNSDSLVKKLLR